MNRAQVRVQSRQPYPLGATHDGSGANFALFSANATRVELCLFDEFGVNETARIDLPEYTDEVWHGYVPGLRPGQLYGYRVHGPWAPHQGHRFNHHKSVLDPYAKALKGSLTWNDALYGYGIGAPQVDMTSDSRDSAPFMPKCVVVEAASRWRPSLPWRRDTRPHTPWGTPLFMRRTSRG